MNTSIRLGKILGIPIGINYSWLFIFLLFIFLMSRQFGEMFPFWSPPQRWVVAVITTVLFFMSVLAHELSHSLVAVHKGIPVKGITLFIFGGVSQLAHEARRPFTEFLVAIVGPLTSILIGLALLGIWMIIRETHTTVGAVLFSLFAINLALGVFNMLPGFPLDGGRVLRSVIWGLTGSYWRATQISVRAGQLIGGLLVATGVGWTVFFIQFQGIWLVLIGAFLFVAATFTYRQERARESMRRYRVADVTTTDWFALPGETILTSPLVAQGLGGRDDFLGVLVAGQMRGIVTRQQLAQLPVGSWPYTTLAQVMIPLQSIPKTDPADAIFDVVEGMEADHVDRMAVVSNGVLLGFINRSSAQRFVRALLPTRLGI
jgi:Zn-dependent protease